MIFSNPFYAGILVNKTLNGKAVQGKHPALISQEEFLKINEIRKEAGGEFGTYHNTECEEIPLKVFAKGDACGSPLTGYVVKTKNIFYYKCRTNGCRVNQNAKRMNNQFADFLTGYVTHENVLEPLPEIMTEA